MSIARTYNDVARKASRLGLIRGETVTVQDHVTAHALDGLYFVIGEEERRIRRDAWAALVLRRAAREAGKRRVAVHSEDEDRMIARKHFAARGKPETHPVWRDAESARMSTERVLRLARAAGRRLHVLHITTGDEIPLLAAAKDFATAETTPQHLTLSAPDLPHETQSAGRR